MSVVNAKNPRKVSSSRAVAFCSQGEMTGMIDSNRQNDVDRSFLPVSVRYVRLYVVSPTQAVGMDATRIYEFDLW